MRIIYLIASLVLLFSCKQTSDSLPASITDTTFVDTVTMINNIKSGINIQTNSFAEIDTSDVLMFPLSIGETARGGSASYYKEVPGNSYRT